MSSGQSYPRRLIEVDLPIKRISVHARREKLLRHGHISTLHIWWARRPLAACRAVICAALWPDPVDEICPESFRQVARAQMGIWAADHQKLSGEESWKRFVAISKTPQMLEDNAVLRQALLDFIADFANWDNSSVREYLDTSQALTQAAHEALGGAPGTRPLVVDPFAGGGSIPLEALRVGADAFASDLNPIPVLLNKVVLEYIPKHGHHLANEVRKWGEWIKREAEKELGSFYPKDADGSTTIGYLWARTALSEAPGQGSFPVEIPLITSFWLARTRGSKRALRWRRDKAGRVATETVEVEYANGQRRRVIRPLLEIISPNRESDVEAGPMARSSATCPLTGYTTQATAVRGQFKSRRGGADDARLFGVVKLRPNMPGRQYCLATEDDVDAALRARVELQRRISEHKGAMALVPNEELPYLRSIFNIKLLDTNCWGDLFTSRQLLILTTLVRLVKRAGDEIEKQHDSEMAKALQTCLAFAVDRMADGNSSLTRWQPNRETISNTFGRQALGIIWDFCEANPFCDATRSLSSMFDWIAEVCEHEASSGSPGHAELASATEHPLPDDSAQLFFTDPPYYDAVPYADLSDFFYVWLKRSVADLHPGLFEADLSPKAKEAVQLAERNPKYAYKTRENYERLTCGAMAEGRRVLQPTQVGVVVFAHKSTVGWEAQLQAMVDAGWTITGSWPIDTEMGSRLRAMNSAVLASSVHLVCRPRESPDGSVRLDEVGDWREVLQELPRRIHEWMPRLAEEGVVGADAIFACLGPALEVFSRYSRVEKASGEVVTLKEYLEQVWAAVAQEALTLIFEDADATGLEEDARLTAMWLWTLSTGGNGVATTASDRDADSDGSDDEEEVGKGKMGAGFLLEFDAARKIAQGLGANLDALKHVVEIKGDEARLLSVAERTRYLFGKDAAQQGPVRLTKKKPEQLSLFAELVAVEKEAGWGEVGLPPVGETTLNRIHQAMILFAAGRAEALKRFLVEGGVGRDGRFWKLAQSLSALYPAGTDEKRWVDGVLARKKGMGLG